MAKSSLYNKIKEIQNVKNTKITSVNIKSGINIFGINGNFTSNANMTSYDLASSKTGYVNGQKITGSLREYTNTSMSIPIDVTVNNISQNITGSYNNIYKIQEDNRTAFVGDGVIRNKSTFNITYNQISSLLNIQAIDIKKDKQILDITGQYDASTEFQGIKMDPIKASNNSISLMSSITEISGLDMTEGTNLAMFFTNLQNLVSISNIKAPNVSNLAYFANNDTKLVKFQNVNFCDESKLTGVNTYSMFGNCSNLKNIDNSVQFPYNINTSGSMFYECRNLISIDTPINSHMTDAMFYNCKSLLNVPKINTSNFATMFSGCSNLQNVSNITFYNSKNTYNGWFLFNGCSSLNIDTLYIPGQVTSSQNMFADCSSITKEQLVNFIDRTTTFNPGPYTFYGTGINSVLTIQELNNKFSSSGANAPFLYANCLNITTINLDEVAAYNLSNYAGMFANCLNLTIATSNNGFVKKDCFALFMNCYNLKTVTIGFNETYRLDSIALNCSNLTDFSIDANSDFWWYIDGLNNSFSNCSNLINIDNLDLILNKQINSATNAFCDCYNLIYNKPMNLNITYQAGNMFRNCYNLTSDVNVKFSGGANYWATALYNAFNSTGIGNLNIDYTITSNQIGISGIITNCPNIKHFSLNTKLNSGTCYMYTSIYDVPNLKTLDLIFDGNFNTYAFGLECPISNCPNLTDLNIICNQTNNSYKFTLRGIGTNIPNLTNLNFDIKPEQNLDSYFFIHNCPKLSDSSIDNIFGVLYEHKSNFIKTNAYNITGMFANCNFTNERLSNIPNWSKMQEMNYYI